LVTAEQHNADVSTLAGVMLGKDKKLPKGDAMRDKKQRQAALEGLYRRQASAQRMAVQNGVQQQSVPRAVVAQQQGQQQTGLQGRRPPFTPGR
jgi:hypothetical protein